MQRNTQNRQAGVWLDQRIAIIISRDPEDVDGDYAIQGKVDSDMEPRSGNEHTINSGKQSDILKYFKNLANQLSEYDELLVFGPGKMQEQFRNFAQEDVQFKDKKITLDTAEHQTDPQMIAQVREFFE